MEINETMKNIKDSFYSKINLGTFLRMKRKNKNLTLNQLSKKVLISRSTLSKIERNEIKTPRAIHLYKLSKELNIKYELLLELQGYDMEYIRYRDRRDNYK